MDRRTLGAASGRDVEKIVTRFEAAWIVDGDADLRAFLPKLGHPDRPRTLLELVAVDLERRWADGRPRSLEDYRLDFPELGDLDLGELIGAEAALKAESGGKTSARLDRSGVDAQGWGWPSHRSGSSRSVGSGRSKVDLAGVARSYLAFRIDNGRDDPRSIDAWAASNGDAATTTVAWIADLHRSDPKAAERLAEGLVRLPDPGDTFLGFKLHSELGRGAFGRVYLASQGDLADRPVALKVSAEKPDESRTLAQLQHTNIVPIFSAHRVDSLHAVCMPYFGSTTLKDIYEELEDRPSMPTSGQGLLETLASRASSRELGSATGPGSSDPGSVAGPDLRPAPIEDSAVPVARAGASPSVASDTLALLGRMSYVEAVLWIVARLADGLAHAHGRGILHRDVKPANILLTDGGQPMLLDFNLSADTKEPASLASVGGTLPYMAPEHLKAFQGEPLAVDARGDVYALGVILYELLAGRHPFEVHAGASAKILGRMIEERSAPPAGLRERNPRVSPAVESIVRHCLEPDPDRRYQSAADLREDLDRHRADLPLQHAPEPSTRERMAKWSRRHPRLTSSTTVAILIGSLALGIFAGFLARAEKLARLEAVESMARFRDESTTVRYLLNTRVTDRVRRADAVAQGRQALRRYGTLDRPGWRSGPLVAALQADERRELLESVGAMLLLLAKAGQLDVQDLKTDDPARKAGAEAAARLGDLAGPCFEADRSPRALLDQRAELARIMGQVAEAGRLVAEAAQVPMTTALDLELAATAWLDRGEYRKAIPPALEATRLDPRDFWAWFTLGFSYERLGQDVEASACFGTCIALRPDVPYGWFNRGTVHTRRGEYAEARRDFDRASALDPRWPEPLAERAIAENLEGRPADAVRDFDRAFDLGATDTRLYFLRARAKENAGDLEGAKRDLEQGQKREPTHELGYIVRGLSRIDSDPAAAVADFDRALALNPRSLEALQDKAVVLADKFDRIAESEAILDRAVTLYPDFVPSRSSRGVMRAILGRREAAHVDARESLWRDTSPRNLYQLAGIYAVTSKQVPEDRFEAYRLLSTALRGGFGFDLLADDHELDPIRDEPEFRKLLDAAKALRDPAPSAKPGP